jgi:hypothetical protein
VTYDIPELPQELARSSIKDRETFGVEPALDLSSSSLVARSSGDEGLGGDVRTSSACMNVLEVESQDKRE